MQITFRWNETEGEGRPGKADKARLLEAAGQGDIAALDFLKDTANEAVRIYFDAVAAMQENWKLRRAE